MCSIYTLSFKSTTDNQSNKISGYREQRRRRWTPRSRVRCAREPRTDRSLVAWRATLAGAPVRRRSTATPANQLDLHSRDQPPYPRRIIAMFSELSNQSKKVSVDLYSPVTLKTSNALNVTHHLALKGRCGQALVWATTRSDFLQRFRCSDRLLLIRETYLKLHIIQLIRL